MKELKTRRYWFRQEKIKPGLYLYKVTDFALRRTLKTFNKEIFLSVKKTLLKCERDAKRKPQVFTMAA